MNESTQSPSVRFRPVCLHLILGIDPTTVHLKYQGMSHRHFAKTVIQGDWYRRTAYSLFRRKDGPLPGIFSAPTKLECPLILASQLSGIIPRSVGTAEIAGPTSAYVIAFDLLTIGSPAAGPGVERCKVPCQVARQDMCQYYHTFLRPMDET